MRHFVKKLLIAASVCLFAVVLLGMFSREISVPTGHGGSIYIRPPSFWRTVLGGTCRIGYEPDKQISGATIVYDNWFSGPFLVIPSHDDKVLLCLYDTKDIGLWLIKIDTT